MSRAPVVDLARLLDAVIYNWLIGNNDAHGKNFSLLYTGGGPDDIETRLSPLYDIVSTVYYPDLSREMAMKIGNQYSSERVTPKDFEKLAEEAGLAKPLVRRRVPDLAEILLETFPKIDIGNVASEQVAALIRKRSEDAFRNYRGQQMIGRLRIISCRGEVKVQWRIPPLDLLVGKPGLDSLRARLTR